MKGDSDCVLPGHTLRIQQKNNEGPSLTLFQRSGCHFDTNLTIRSGQNLTHCPTHTRHTRASLVFFTAFNPSSTMQRRKACGRTRLGQARLGHVLATLIFSVQFLEATLHAGQEGGWPRQKRNTSSSSSFFHSTSSRKLVREPKKGHNHHHHHL